MTLQDAIYTLDQIGFTDVFLPFILIYTVIFAILNKVNLFSADKAKTGPSRKFNSIIALAISLLVVIPHSLGRYPAGTDVVEIMNSFLPNVSLLILVILFIMMITSFFGLEWGGTGGKTFSSVASLLSVIVLLAIFAVSAGWWTPYGPLSFLLDSDMQATLIIIGVFWLIIGMTLGGDKEGGSTPQTPARPGAPPEGH